jgi:methylthioribose-1-phosphate isomerase
MNSKPLPKSVLWQDDKLYLLDQTKLPHVEEIFCCERIESVHEAICALRVRGAPAIGIAAAYGLVVGLTEHVSLSALRERVDYLVGARPTAVNLAWAVERVYRYAAAWAEKHDDQIPVALLCDEAKLIHSEDAASCRNIGLHGLPLITANSNWLTHCNAGALAVSELGTALAPFYTAADAGVQFHVYVDETRPLLQGARLTSFELGRAGILNTLICDNAAAHVMSLGKVDGVIVGADRIAANGDVANKIGTLGLAILCGYYDIPFYVAAPTSTIDLDTTDGKQILIEERSAHEVTTFGAAQVASLDTKVFNPAFDVTPSHLVKGIITEQGMTTAPFEQNLGRLFDVNSSTTH